MWSHTSPHKRRRTPPHCSVQASNPHAWLQRLAPCVVHTHRARPCATLIRCHGLTTCVGTARNDQTLLKRCVMRLDRKRARFRVVRISRRSSTIQRLMLKKLCRIACMLPGPAASARPSEYASMRQKGHRRTDRFLARAHLSARHTCLTQPAPQPTDRSPKSTQQPPSWCP